MTGVGSVLRWQLSKAFHASCLLMLARWSATVVVVSFVILLYLGTHCAVTQGHKKHPVRGHQSPCHGLSCMRGHLL